DLAFKSLTDLAGLLRLREISSLELTQAFLQRIGALDCTLKSYRLVLEEDALAAARAADAAFARGEDFGPLQGIPIGVKDLCDTAGVTTAGGMTWHLSRVPEQDATLVQRLRAGGAVILGKLTMTQGAMSQHTGMVRPVNPWSDKGQDFWYGSSSSGSGIATAAGLCVAAIGSDTGGSIRFPAFCNGVVGLKPTWGRVSRAGVLPLAPSLDHVGPLSRHIDASAALLRVIAGPDEADRTSLTAPVPDYLAELNRGIAALRIGYDPKVFNEGLHPDIKAGVDAALAGLRAAGGQLEEVTLPKDHGAVVGWIEVCAAETALVHQEDYAQHASLYGPGLGLLVETGRSLSAEVLAAAHLARLDYRGAMSRLFEEIDILLLPLMSDPPPSATDVEEGDPTLEAWRQLIAFSAPAPLTGFPSLQLPSGFDSRGGPVGFQAMAGHLGETKLFQLGAAWQRVTEWHRKIPPLAL
ncbi:MAG: amidase, partial [Pseudomonadota bacterium]